jgi:carbonic anhydrase/acetyltransferase-like protein (isoleucine patch superfamily)
MQEPFFGALDGHRPQIAESAFVAPATVVVGRVRISTLQCTVQERAAGDDEEIVIGEDTNVQDL